MMSNDPNSATVPNNQPMKAGQTVVSGKPPIAQTVSASSVSLGKEKELVKTQEGLIQEVGQEQELHQEVKQAGVVVRQEDIEIPEEAVSLGLKPTGVSTPVPATPSLKLPITDNKIEEGLHLNLLHSLRWLAQWCLFQLKRAHLVLKVIHGRIIRVRIKN